ncbi:MAG: hypothetical protein HC767_02465 [Akkermansiaceae bacterium]|nr:hypothetical protein [Akkermansiaceae bacterium]
MRASFWIAIAMAGAAFLAADVAVAHNCHRSCQLGAYGWHRHVGYNCVRVSCERPRARCRTKCNWIGPFKQCKTVCD